MTRKRKKVLKFTEGDEFEWAASIIDNYADALDANLPSYVDDLVEYAGVEGGIARLHELSAKIVSKKHRKKMTTDDWESVLLYLCQEVAE